jgi:hypothetical protein
MKISDEEINAAQDAFWATAKGSNDSVIDAIKAAFRVRKRRKQERKAVREYSS